MIIDQLDAYDEWKWDLETLASERGLEVPDEEDWRFYYDKGLSAEGTLAAYN